MPLGSKKISHVIPEEGLGCLRGCLVEGDAEQRSRERCIRRRALAISILFQSAVLATLILVPLFGKTQRIALAYSTPAPPYSRYPNSRLNSVSTPRNPSRPHSDYHFYQPTNISPKVPTRDSRSSGEEIDETPLETDGIDSSYQGSGLIPVGDPNARIPPPLERHHQSEQPRRLRITDLDPAMLMHRVEPVYPPLAKQTHREGHVELRAVIGTDGTIQSLQIVVSDPLFDRSALEAVGQWRYKPTILNGQPVEIDTYITVIYNMPH